MDCSHAEGGTSGDSREAVWPWDAAAVLEKVLKSPVSEPQLGDPQLFIK